MKASDQFDMGLFWGAFACPWAPSAGVLDVRMGSYRIKNPALWLIYAEYGPLGAMPERPVPVVEAQCISTGSGHGR